MTDRFAPPDEKGMRANAPDRPSADNDSSCKAHTSQFNELFSAQKRALNALQRRGRLRSLSPRHGLDFASNDYLGLASCPQLRDKIVSAIKDDQLEVGSGGSRLLRGNHPQHDALEREAAEFFGSESALYFPGGFSANASLIATLPQRGDIIVYDEHIHASTHDGMAQTKAKTAIAEHNSAKSFSDTIARWRSAGGTGTPWIVVESLYSMDGDIAPLDDLAALAESESAVLVIDEAHATGVYGPEGRGLAAHLEGRPNVITLHTCGKALGVMGGLICAPQIVRGFLINRARAFIYATAPTPTTCAAVRAAIQISKSEPAYRKKLMDNIQHAQSAFQKKLGFVPASTQIQPVILGRETDTVSVASALQDAGFDIRAIRPPTVPEGTARLRIAITNNVSKADIDAMVTSLSSVLKEQKITPIQNASADKARQPK